MIQIYTVHHFIKLFIVSVCQSFYFRQLCHVRYRPADVWNKLSFLIIANVYEARNKLLGLEEPRVIADIPQTYIPDTPSPGTVYKGKEDKLELLQT
jgi:hypothetical protein